MTDLKSISGIGKTSLELLEAAGILDARTLANAGLEELVAELGRANRILRIAKRPPRKAEIEKWILSARDDLGFEPLPGPPATSDTPPNAAKGAPASNLPVNYEATESVREMLATAPPAIPLPARQLIDAGVAVSEIPSAILLNRYVGDLEIRVTDRKGPRGIPRAPKLSKSRAASGTYVHISEPSPTRLQIDTTRLRSIANLEPAQTRVPAPRAAPVANGGSAIATSPETDRVALLRAPLAATNRGRNPQSRRYIRGVLHSHPGSMMFGALVTLLMMALTVPALVAAALLLLSDLYPQVFHWVSPQLLVLPCALPVIGILYLIYAVKGKCRICNQHLFFRRSCRKNSKAHRIPGLGYIVSVSIHMLLFRWFRCTYCGTPVRLKK